MKRLFVLLQIIYKLANGACLRSYRRVGAPIIKATVRVTFWGALAMALTAAVGALFGVAA